MENECLCKNVIVISSAHISLSYINPSVKPDIRGSRVCKEGEQTFLQYVNTIGILNSKCHI